MAELDCDVAIIGAGTAGISAERKARGASARTRLIDPDFSGTTCASVGCMPSKLLIAAANAAHGVATADKFGIRAEARIDGPAVMNRVQRMRDDFVKGVQQGFDDLPEGTTIRATARFSGPGRLSLSDGRTLRARAIVIATGSAPAIPGPYRDLGPAVITNADLFDLPDLPDSLAVIGAGPIGIEMAQALARLGVRVEVFDIGEKLAGLPDETGAHLHKLLEAELPIHLGVTPEPSRDGDGVRISFDGYSERFDKVLVAAGRPPSLDGLDPEKAGIETNDKGVPLFDPLTMQCGDLPVFIAGDANADLPLLHEASDEGAIAGANAANWPEVNSAQRRTRMQVTFTHPTAASVGEPPCGRTVTGRADFANQGRTRVEGRPGGLLRLHADGKSGRLTGADMCLPDGEHIAHAMAWLIDRDTTAQQALRLPFYHPTIEEGVRTAFRDLCRNLHTQPDWNADDGAPPGC